MPIKTKKKITPQLAKVKNEVSNYSSKIINEIFKHIEATENVKNINEFLKYASDQSLCPLGREQMNILEYAASDNFQPWQIHNGNNRSNITHKEQLMDNNNTICPDFLSLQADGKLLPLELKARIDTYPSLIISFKQHEKYKELAKTLGLKHFTYLYYQYGLRQKSITEIKTIKDLIENVNTNGITIFTSSLVEEICKSYRNNIDTYLDNVNNTKNNINNDGSPIDTITPETSEKIPKYFTISKSELDAIIDPSQNDNLYQMEVNVPKEIIRFPGTRKDIIIDPCQFNISFAGNGENIKPFFKKMTDNIPNIEQNGMHMSLMNQINKDYIANKTTSKEQFASPYTPKHLSDYT